MVEPHAKDFDFSTLPVDESFFGLHADYYAKHHLIAADGEGALAVERVLKSDPPLGGRKTVVYADTGKRSHGHIDRLAQLAGIELHLRPTTLALIRWITAFDLTAHMPLRLYAAGSSRLLNLVSELAQRAGIERESIMREVIHAGESHVQCLTCASVFFTSAQLTCSCPYCGESLKIQPHYDLRTGSYLGTPLATKYQPR